MSAQQQQPSRGFYAAYSSTSPASATQNPAQAASPPRRSPEYTLRAPGPSPLDNMAPRTRLPRPISPHINERRTTYASAADRTHNRGSRNSRSPAGDPLPSQADAFAASQRAASRAPPPRLVEPQPSIDSYIPDYRSRPLPPQARDGGHSQRENNRRPDNGTVSNPRSENNYRPSYAAEPPLPRPRRGQEQAIRPWERKEDVKAASPNVETAPERKLEPPKPSDFPYYDAIIAGLDRKYNKPKPKAGSPSVPTNILEPERRAASPPHAVLGKVQKPTRPYDSQTYSTWGKDALLHEVKLRQLHHESEDSPHLTSVLAMHDKEFLRKCLKLSNYKTSKDLRKRADLLHIVVSDHGVGQYQPLVEEMAEVLARRAVSQHHKKVRMSQKQSYLEAKGPNNNAMKTETEKTPANGSRQTVSKATTVTLKSILGLIGKDVSPNDSGYSSPSMRPSSTPQEQISPDEGGGEPKPSVEADEKLADSKKRSLPIGFEKETQTSPKRPKATPENKVGSRKKKAHRARTASATAGDDGEEMKVDSVQPAAVFVFGASPQVAEPMTAAKETVSAEENESQRDASEEEIVIVTGPKSPQKRKSLDTNNDEDTEQFPVKVAKPNPSRSVASPKKKASKDKQPNEMEGLPTKERVPGQVYVRSRDGSWKLPQSAKASKKAPDADSVLKFFSGRG